MRREATGVEIAHISEVGGLTLDSETRQARFADVVVKLTQREVELLDPVHGDTQSADRPG